MLCGDQHWRSIRSFVRHGDLLTLRRQVIRDLLADPRKKENREKKHEIRISDKGHHIPDLIMQVGCKYRSFHSACHCNNCARWQ